MPNADKSPFITSGHRFRNFLGWGIAVSLLIHLFATPFLKNLTQHSEEQQVEKVSVTKRIIVKPPTPPPPTPTPPPPKSTPPPKQTVQQPQQQLKVEPPKTHSNSSSSTSENKYVPPKNGSTTGVPNGVASSGPGPVATNGPPASTPTPKPACKTPEQEAQATQPVNPEYPDQAREQGLGRVVVNVVVSLSASGAPTNAVVQNSSGNMAMDQSAKRAAMQSVYVPKIIDCQPVASQYIYTVTFDPNG